MLLGDYVVPVADCGREQFSAHPKSEMKMADYLQYWSSVMKEGGERSISVEGLLYLKDWHLAKYVEFINYMHRYYHDGDGGGGCGLLQCVFILRLEGES